MSTLHLPFAALLATCLLLATPIAAQTTPWAQQPREVEFRSDDRGFRFSSTRAGQPEVLEASFDAAQARYEWSYRPNATSTPTRSLWTLHALLEWRDADRDGRLGVGDQIVHTQPVKALANRSLESLPGPVGGHVVHVTYPFPGGRPGPLDPLTGRKVFSDAALTLSFTIPGPDVIELATDHARVLLDVRVEKWPRHGNDTRLALEMQLQSTGAMRVQDLGWTASTSEANQTLGWQPTYERNGTGRPSVLIGLERPGPVGIDAQGAQSTLLAAYEFGNILHSFSFGTEPRPQSLPDLASVVRDLLGDPRVYASGFLLAALVVGITSARKMRGRR